MDNEAKQILRVIARALAVIADIKVSLNDGNVKRHTMERLESFVSGTKGKRLTYKALIQ